jgi:hypothetical protein
MFVNRPVIEKCLAQLLFDRSDLFDCRYDALESVVKRDDFAVALYAQRYKPSKQVWVQIPRDQDAVLSIKCVGPDNLCQGYSVSIGGVVDDNFRKPFLLFTRFYKPVHVLVPPNTLYIEVVCGQLSAEVRRLAMSSETFPLSDIAIASDPLGNMERQFALLDLF